jgi:HSP20 family protein
MPQKNGDRKQLKSADYETMVRPRCQVEEKAAGDIVLKLEMPGVAKQDLDIDVDASELRIVGRRPAAKSTGTYLARERPQGGFRQVYTLDDTIDRERIDAVLEGGILTLTLHRKEAVKPRKILIRS